MLESNWFVGHVLEPRDVPQNVHVADSILPWIIFGKWARKKSFVLIGKNIGDPTPNRTILILVSKSRLLDRFLVGRWRELFEEWLPAR